MRTEGSAYLDRSGRVLAADTSFCVALGLRGTDTTAALRERASGDARLAALVAGDGPDRTTVAGLEGLGTCEVSRVQADGGMLLHAVAEHEGITVPTAELVIQAITLARLAGSVAHEVKNPLNAMALQLALLGDKIATASDALGAACAGNLASIKNQIGRINEVVRRYVEVADPTPSAGFDAGSLLADAASLFGHEARRRRIALTCDASPGAVRAAGDGGRAARLLLGVFWRAVSTTPAGARLLARAVPSDGEAVVSLEHPVGEPDPQLAWIGEAVAAALREMGGRLEESLVEGIARTALVLPKESAL